jgi:nicotinamidase-related amidase
MTHALLIIDVQESFRQRPLWRAVDRPDIVERVDRLVTASRARGDLVVWVLHAEPDTGTVFDPARGQVRPMAGLHPRDDEPVLVKTSINAFTTTNLAQLLTLRGIRDLVVCGIRTEQCVETTSRVAADLGYAVTFVTDATATFPIPHRDLPEDVDLETLLADPRTLASADVVARTEYALAHRFATIATVDEVVGVAAGALAGRSG